MKKILDGFYVFTEQAKNPPVQGFTFNPVDLDANLESLGTQNFRNDYEFTVKKKFFFLSSSRFMIKKKNYNYN